MKKIYIFAAVLALLTLSLNAQEGVKETATSLKLQTTKKANPKDKAPSMNELLRGIKGMSSVLQASQGPTCSSNAGSNRAPLRLNADEELVGPFTTYDTSTSGYNSYGFPTAYGNNYQQIYIFSDLDRSDFVDHDGDEIVGFRFALGGNTSQTAVLYDFMAWPYSTNGYFEAANRHTWSISEAAGAQPFNTFDDIVITVPGNSVVFSSITVYDQDNNVVTSWNSSGTVSQVDSYTVYDMPDGWYLGNYYFFRWSSGGNYYGYLSTTSEASITIDGSFLDGCTSARIVINAMGDYGVESLDVNGDTRTVTTSIAPYTFNLSPSGTSTPTYQELQAGQWHEYYLDEPIPFSVADSISGMYLGYRYFQYPSTETNELLYPIAVNPNSTNAGIVTNRYGQNGTTTAIGDITITIPSTYSNVRTITVSSGNTTITSYSYANNSNTFPAGWYFDGTIGLRYDYSNVVSLYSSDGTGSITISGDLFEGYNSVTVSIYFSTSTRNQTATVGVNGTNRSTTNRTGVTENWTINGTTVPTYVGGWWDENLNGDLAVQLIFKSSLNPMIEISPATQTINDAAAGTLTVTGTDITGNINVSAANDWSLNPNSLSNTGGNVSVSYTGRDLIATTTVTATAANDNTVTALATVNYVADVYIVGNFSGNGWNFNNGTQMSYNNGIYTATLTASAGDYILFARILGNGNPWNTRDVFGPNSSGDWWMQGNSASGNIDVNDDDPIYFTEGGTYRITINANDGTFTIIKLNGEQTAPPVITYTVDGEYVTITATGNGTVTLNVPGYDPVIDENGEASITIPCGAVSNTITVTATAKEDGKDESIPTTEQITIPAGSGWLLMDGTYNNPNDLLSFQRNGEDIALIDQFLASTLENEHPDHYTYTLRQTTNGEAMTSTPVSIPVYKTSSTMQGFYTKGQVDTADLKMELKSQVINSEMDFDVKPDRNTLYYSLYRSNLNGDYPVIDVPHRVSQLQRFQEMVGDYPQYFLFETHQDGVAPRYDHIGSQIVERLDTNYVQGEFNDELSYVPVIWTYGLYTARGDGKNNSYGSDIKREYLGGVSATITGEKSDYSAYGMWTANGVEYCVYTPVITITGTPPAIKTDNDGDVSTYVPYMYRAWCLYEGAHDFTRNSDGQLIDNGVMTAPILLDERVSTETGEILGGPWQVGMGRLPWAFGIPVDEDGDNVTFAIRFYYKKVVTDAGQGEPNNLRDGEEEYYIVECEGDAQGITTAINELFNGRVPVETIYYNSVGMQSDKPFDGINIVVTHYSDGTSTTTKVVR